MAQAIHIELSKQPIKDWRTWAACRGTDPNTFFPNRGESITPAKIICGTCIVQVECLEDAIIRREPAGVRAGLSTRDRRVLIGNRADAKLKTKSV